MFAGISQYPGHSAAGLGDNIDETTARMPHGAILTLHDNWWGAVELMYARAAGTIRGFGLCVATPAFNSTLQRWRYDMTEVPNTANLGRPLSVSLAPRVLGQYGWFVVGGLTPVNCTASVAADTAFGIVAAGQGGAIANGKQILNSRIAAPATTTVAKDGCIAQSGSLVLNVPNAEGWFVGAYVSGTGIAAGAYITKIDVDGRTVTMSAVTTAQVAGTVTATYNNATIYYNIAHLNRPFAQGQTT